MRFLIPALLAFNLVLPSQAGDKSAVKPLNLEKLNNSEAKRGDLSPSLSAEGTRLYFASDRPSGKGDLDIWMVFTNSLK